MREKIFVAAELALLKFGKASFAATLTLCLLFSAIARSETVERIVAVVGSDVITLYDLDRAMAPYITEINKAPNKEDKFRSVKAEVLDRLVDDILLKQEMENSKITVTNDDLTRYIRSMLNQNQITIDMFKGELAKKGISYESYKEDLRQNIKRMRFINQEVGARIKISDQDLKDYYDKHMNEFGKHGAVHIAQIVLPFDESTTKEKALEIKAKGAEIVKQARSGTSFASLAKQYSKGLNAETGGDMGIIDPSKIIPEIAVAMEKMKPGQISEPIVTPNGITIVQLIDRSQTTGADFEKLRDKIYDQIYNQRMQDEISAYTTEIRKKSYVEIRN